MGHSKPSVICQHLGERSSLAEGSWGKLLVFREMTLHTKTLGTAFYLHIIPTSSQCLVWLFMKTFVFSVYSRYPLQRVYKAGFWGFFFLPPMKQFFLPSIIYIIPEVSIPFGYTDTITHTDTRAFQSPQSVIWFLISQQK